MSVSVWMFGFGVGRMTSAELVCCGGFSMAYPTPATRPRSAKPPTMPLYRRIIRIDRRKFGCC